MSATLSPTRLLIRLSQAGVKRAQSLFRTAAHEHPEWQARAEICVRCPLYFADCNKKPHCGKPFLSKVNRDEATEGCGCPIVLKAKDPSEHCPRNQHYETSSKLHATECDCVWCATLRARSEATAPPARATEAASPMPQAA